MDLSNINGSASDIEFTYTPTSQQSIGSHSGKAKKPLNLSINPNTPMNNLTSLLRNTPPTPGSALTFSQFGNGGNDILYSQAAQPPSNVLNILSPVNPPRFQPPSLYNHKRSSSSHLSGYSSYFSENASPVTTNPPLKLAPASSTNSGFLNGGNLNSNFAMNSNFNNTSWHNTPTQSPSNRSPPKSGGGFVPGSIAKSQLHLKRLFQEPETMQQSPMSSNFSFNPSMMQLQYEPQDTYNDNWQQHQLPMAQDQQALQFVPPSRAPGPIPYFSDSTVQVKSQPRGHKRGQSVGTLSRDFQFTSSSQYPLPPLNVYNSYKEYEEPTFGHVKKLPAPTVKKINFKDELTPRINHELKFRRASIGSEQISPLKALTVSIITSYSLCRPEFSYKSSCNPRRVLTKPSEPTMNKNFDNVDSDYILYVNDVLGVEESRKYLVLDILGKGTFGQVVKCQNLNTKEIIAVKVIKSKPAYMNQSLTEVSILETINNKIDPQDKHHFLRLKDRFMHQRHLCIAFELLSNNLYELIKQNQFNGLDMDLIQSFAKQLLNSLIILKSHKIIHCDLKPENILLVCPDKPELKIIDFGSACYERQTVYTYIQSRFYRSPEVILGLPYTCAIDMWSFGCIIAELFLGLPLLPGSSEYNQISRILDTFGYPPSWMIEMGKNTANFMEKIPAYPPSSAFNNPEENSTSFYKYRLKSIEKYSAENKNPEKPSKNYFNSLNLAEIIGNYQPRTAKNRNSYPKRLTDRQQNDRLNLIHFLRGILNINPLERWTPQQAIAHPFISSLPYDENWKPQGLAAPNISNVGRGQNHRVMNMHKRGQLSTSAINFSSGMNNFNGNDTTPFPVHSDLYPNKADDQVNNNNGNFYFRPTEFNVAANKEPINSFKFPLN